ncbi:MAG: excinuclease ABC subunit UvrC [Dehalococcoidia bacterium]
MTSQHPRSREFADRLGALPAQPGVYLMKDAEARVIYVGKAASLRSRVRSYFQTPAGKERKVQVLVSRIADFEYIVAETVQEALLLENLLIKQHKPFYNARLKDDKTYPYIKIDLSEDFPQVYFTRRVLPDGARYFGPFASAGSVRKTMDLLKKLFPYRSCTKTITGTDERPCLEYYIHRCVGPCIGVVDKQEYASVIHQVLKFLNGDSEEVEQELKEKMAAASEALEFERAAVLRDQVRAIGNVSERQKVVSARDEDSDVIALAQDKGEVWVEVFKVRKGKLIGRDHFLMEGGEAEDEPRLIEEFVQQFYDAAPDVPPTLLLQYAVEDAAALEQWLSGKRGRKVSVLTPQRGEKKRLVAMATENALQGLNQRRLKWLSESDKVLQALVELQEALSLADLPNRIECYDISNIQGTNSVGSMVVFEEGRPKTSLYRRFQIRDVQGIDDYSSMQEMLRRRFKRLGEIRSGAALAAAQPDDPASASAPLRSRRHRPRHSMGAEASTSEAPRISHDSWGQVPSLVIIDGGKGHLNAVQQVFLELGITDIPLCSLAKQEEEIYLPHMPEPVLLPRGSQSLYLVQRIRDEAHRFAITYHRQRRSKAATRSILDSAPGIGPKRRRDLLRRFGSAQGIRQATLEDIASVPGMSVNSARKLAEYLGGGIPEPLEGDQRGPA